MPTISPSHYPALLVEFGAVFVLVAALASRVLLSRFGIPSIVTLLAFGLGAGPSGLNVVHIDLTDPGTRALLQLAVVVVLFEVTLRIDLHGVPLRSIAVLTLVGAGLTLALVPMVSRAYHLTPLLGSMISAICIVTGPTVVGPLMARIRPRRLVSHLLESEGLVLDALGVIVASVVFTTYTSRPGSPLGATLSVAHRVGAGVLVGACWGVLGRYVLALTSRASSDLSKLGVLLVGFGAYASADWLAHESGLVAVVVCGLLLDFRGLPHERLVRAFKEDLSMLALSVVFVLLASQIDVEHLGAFVAPAAAIAGLLIAVRVVAVAAASVRTPFSLGERLLMSAMFPRGIVAVSLATYYATQIPAWGLHGEDRLLGVLFLIVTFTIVLSTPLALAIASRLHLQMPAAVFAGITPATLEAARQYQKSGYLPVLVDLDDQAVAFARSQDFDALSLEDGLEVGAIVRERRAGVLVMDSSWRLAGSVPDSVSIVAL